MKLFTIAIASLLLAGCAHKAQVHIAPDSAPLAAAQAEAANHVAKAHAASVRAQEAVQKARHFHNAEGVEIKDISEAIDVPEFRNAPPDLLPLIEGIRTQLATHAATHEQTAAQLLASDTAATEATSYAFQAEKKLGEVTNSIGPAYIAAAEGQTQKLNEIEAKWARDSKSLLWYRMRFFLGIVLCAIGIIGSVAFYVLKIASR